MTISSVLKTYIDVFESLEGSGEGVVLGSQFEPLGPQEIERLQRLQPCSTTQVEEKEYRQNKRAKLSTRYESLLSQFDASLSEVRPLLPSCLCIADLSTLYMLDLWSICVSTRTRGRACSSCLEEGRCSDWCQEAQGR